MVVSCILEIKRYIRRKSWCFSYPLHSAPSLGGSRQNINIPFSMEISVWSGYAMVKKFDDTCNRFDKIPVCDGQTDRQTDKRRDRHTDILRRHSPHYAYTSRGKNHHYTTTFNETTFNSVDSRRRLTIFKMLVSHSMSAVLDSLFNYC